MVCLVMRRKGLAAFIVLAVTLVPRAGASDLSFSPRVGVQRISIGGEHGRSEFSAHVWYPATGGTPAVFGASRIRPGYEAVAGGDVTLEPQSPLVVLIHGSGGSAESMAWIATDLARRGLLVVGADHPGSSAGDPERLSMLSVWEQPADVRTMIDYLLVSEWSTYVDRDRIAIVGFSLGGSSALLLAGARLDFARFPEFCRTHDDGACRAFERHFPSLDESFLAHANADHSDPRIAVTIAIAPGFTESMTRDSIEGLDTPTLLITGEFDQQLPPLDHLPPILPFLPPESRHHEVAGAQHFSFLPLCGIDAIEVLAETEEEFVCQEFGTRTRAEVHAETLTQIITFLESAWLP
jgi:predicted dienelactone hydrolase